MLWGGEGISVAWLNNQNQCSVGGYWEGTVDNRSTSTYVFPIFRAKKGEYQESCFEMQMVWGGVKNQSRCNVLPKNSAVYDKDPFFLSRG